MSSPFLLGSRARETRPLQGEGSRVGESWGGLEHHSGERLKGLLSSWGLESPSPSRTLALPNPWHRESAPRSLGIAQWMSPKWYSQPPPPGGDFQGTDIKVPAWLCRTVVPGALIITGQKSRTLKVSELGALTCAPLSVIGWVRAPSPGHNY